MLLSGWVIRGARVTACGKTEEFQYLNPFDFHLLLIFPPLPDCQSKQRWSCHCCCHYLWFEEQEIAILSLPIFSLYSFLLVFLGAAWTKNPFDKMVLLLAAQPGGNNLIWVFVRITPGDGWLLPFDFKSEKQWGSLNLSSAFFVFGFSSIPSSMTWNLVKAILCWDVFARAKNIKVNIEAGASAILITL